MHNTEEKQGYKFTEEFGYIPEDWDIVPLGDFISTEKYAIVDGPFGSNLKTEHYRKKGIPIIQSGFVTSNKFIADSYLYVDEEKFQQEIRSKVIPGDIVMAKIGANCGTCAILPNNHPEGILAGNSLKITVRENCNKFLMYLFHRLLPLNKMEEAISRTAQPALSCGRLKILPIIKPPFPEQEKIAEVLSDIDELIESTQKLIDKKKDLKTATMQKLLTPKPHWVAKKLGEIGIITGGGVDKKINANEISIRLVNFLDVYHNNFITSKLLNHWVTAPKDKINQCKVIKGDIFFTPSSEMRYDIAMSAVAVENIENAVYSYHIVRFRLKEKWDLAFSSYIFNTNYFLSQAETICEGSGKRYVITLPKFRNMKIKYPEDIGEQKQIARTLFDMDAEIEALEKELSKYKDLKTGMMQELLTGKKRLV